MISIEQRLIDVCAHLRMVVDYGLAGISDEIDRAHILDALAEARHALEDLRAIPDTVAPDASMMVGGLNL